MHIPQEVADDGSSTSVPTTHVGDTGWVVGFWFRPSPTPATVDIWGVSQWKISVFVSLSDKMKIYFKNNRQENGNYQINVSSEINNIKSYSMSWCLFIWIAAEISRCFCYPVSFFSSWLLWLTHDLNNQASPFTQIEEADTNHGETSLVLKIFPVLFDICTIRLNCQHYKIL